MCSINSAVLTNCLEQLLKFKTRMFRDFLFHMMDNYNKGVLAKEVVIVVADCVTNFICMK